MRIQAPTGRNAIRLVCLLTLAAASVSTLYGQGSSVRVETFVLKPKGKVIVENSRGAISVETWQDQTVRIVAEKKTPTASGIDASDLVLMGAQNSVIVQCKPAFGRVDLTLYVPADSGLQLTGGVWPVEVAGSLASAVIETTSGNISFRMPSNEDARVTLRSAQGIVRSMMPLNSLERIGTRSLRGQLGTGVAQVTCNSHSGNVTLTPAPAVAKVSSRETDVAAAKGTSTSTDVSSEDQPSTSTPHSVEQRDALAGTGRGRNSQSSGSVVFAGSDRSDNSTSTTTSGPFVRPREQRTTSGGNSGLNVRIIPSNAPPNTSRDDQSKDEADATSVDQSSPGTATSTKSNAGSGSVVFAGDDRADNGTSHSRVGPLERDRAVKNTSGGNSGLRVRIIPAPSTTPARNSNPVFDQPPADSTGSAARSNSDVELRSKTDRTATEADVESDRDESNSRAARPPVLQRSGGDYASTTSPASESGANRVHDNEAIVLKAALVNLNVSVTNRAGVALANLKKEDFAVAENGEQQKIEFFQPSTAPFNLVLALDLSGSIKDKLDIIKSAALRFLDVVSPQDKVAVVTFTDQIRVVSQLTSDREELKRRIKLIDRSQGGTAFYEAMWFALVDTLRGTGGQRNAIVVMTDGVDSSLDRYNPMQTRVSFNQLARRLEESDVLTFPIYLDTEYEEVFERGNSTSEAYAIARDQLERVAELTGGQMFKAEKASDLSGVYKQVAAAIRTVYSVGYYPINPERDGTFRRVRVLVNRPDAAVRTRKGYYAK
ncbi:MAG TPA: VWA domain-containing protein [Blastocatellia bacterium]